MAAFERESERAFELSRSDDPDDFPRWLDTASMPAIHYFETQMQRAVAYGGNAHLILKEVQSYLRRHHRAGQTRAAARQMYQALLLSPDPETAVATWAAEQAHPCSLEGTLRWALHEGHHRHIPALVTHAECLNPELVILSAMSAKNPVPLAWVVHWFEQLSPGSKAAIFTQGTNACVDHQRLDWLAAWVAQGEATTPPLAADWESIARTTVANEWVAGANWLSAQPQGQRVMLQILETEEHGGNLRESNWVMCRLPSDVRADTLAVREAVRPGAYAQATAHHHAELRQRQTQGLGETAPRRRLRS